jgi:hypothetical protein
LICTNSVHSNQEPFIETENVYHVPFKTSVNLVKSSKVKKDQFLQLLPGKEKLIVFLFFYAQLTAKLKTLKERAPSLASSRL